MHCNLIGRISVLIPLGAQPGTGTQQLYEGPGDFRVETIKNTTIDIGLVMLSLRQ